ncbi:16359_t:CDS:2, partial [Cetraspora pellucida]
MVTKTKASVKRKHLMAEEKKKICEKKRKFLSILNNELAEDYAEATCKCNRQPKWPKLDEAMHIWVESTLIANMDLNQEALIIKAKTFATALSITDFKDTVESLNEHREHFQAICEEYTLNNIWNADETSLCWRMHSSKTLACVLSLLDAFDKMKATGSSSLNGFSILNAINATSDACSKVTQETIMNAWLKTVSSEIDDPMDVRKFVDINTDVAFEMPSDDDIICNIGNKDDHPTEEEILEPAPKIMDHDALKALDLIEMYLLQQLDDFIATDNDRNTV